MTVAAMIWLQWRGIRLWFRTHDLCDRRLIAGYDRLVRLEDRQRTPLAAREVEGQR